MKIPILSILFILAATSLLVAEPKPSLMQTAPGTYRMDWQGEAGLTYFFQRSTDLANWSYDNRIDHGLAHTPFVVTPKDANQVPLEKFFLRIAHTDVPTVDPWLDDFDGDGVGNQNELALTQTDPLLGTAQPDADGDGLWDSLEMAFFGNLQQTSLTDEDGDGIVNGVEIDLGGDPSEDESAVEVTQYEYDATGRLEVSQGQSSVSVDYDEEGNALFLLE